MTISIHKLTAILSGKKPAPSDRELLPEVKEVFLERVAAGMDRRTALSKTIGDFREFQALRREWNIK